ncbi:MAG: sigma-70 family RNA polymerase sigma factor [Candidatus Magasanikbacteria bacterium]|nr:sigma-70 family RNA polymerase sigma factor [Candidatus Magasanikbacteria bacterium]
METTPHRYGVVPEHSPVEDFRSLFAKIQGGDHRAFAVLLARHEDRVRQLVIRYVKNETDVKDIMQGIRMKVWKNVQPGGAVDETMDEKNFHSWLISVTKNHCLDFIRRENRPGRRLDRKTVALDAPRDEDQANALRTKELNQGANQEKETFSAEQRQALRAAMHKVLKPEEIEVVAMHYVWGMTEAAIAEELGVPLSTIKNRLHRLKPKLAAALHERKDELLDN